MRSDQLKILNRLQIISLCLTLLLLVVPTVGPNDYGTYFGIPVMVVSYYGGGITGLGFNVVSFTINFLMIYYLCKAAYKLWILFLRKQ